MAEPRIVNVKIEELTRERFEPFGEILGPQEKLNAETPLGNQAWFSDYSVDGTALVAYVTFHYKKPPTEYLCHDMEQHLKVKQTVIPMEGKPSIILVAPATPWKSAPDIDKFRAFLLDGTRGVVLDKLSWHGAGTTSPSIFPMYPPTLNVSVIHSKETWEDEINHSFTLTHRTSLKESAGAVIQLNW